MKIGISVLLIMLLILFFIVGCSMKQPDPTDQAYSAVVGYIKAWNSRDQSAVAASFVNIKTGAEMAEKSTRYKDVKYPTTSKIIVAANKDDAWVALTDVYLPVYINGVKQPPKLIFQYYMMKRVGEKFKIDYMSETNMDLLPRQVEYEKKSYKYFREYKDGNQTVP